MKGFKKLVTALGLIAGLSGSVKAYEPCTREHKWEACNLENASTHPLLAGELAKYYRVPEGTTFDLQEIQQGTIDEDDAEAIEGGTVISDVIQNPVLAGKLKLNRHFHTRSCNHFQHWQSGNGFTGEICDAILDLAGIEKDPHSVTKWATSAQRPQAQYNFGNHNWNQAKQEYAQGKIGRSFGHIFHLIADLTVPEHVRNDAHILGHDYESWADSNNDLFMSLSMPGRVPQFSSLEELLSNLAHFTGSNFLSPDSSYGIPFQEYYQKKEAKRLYMMRDVEGKPTHVLRLGLIAAFQDSICYQDLAAIQSPKIIEYGLAALTLLEQEEPSCYDSCEEEDALWCADLSAYICTATEQGCLEAMLQQQCSDECRNGLCVCQDQCAPGSKECQGNSLRVCENNDTDSCTEWSNYAACSEGLICQSGQCVTECHNECTYVGERSCTGTRGKLECERVNNCFRWTGAGYCNSGEICNNGYCQSGCSNECSGSGLRCSENNVVECGNFDSDTCLEQRVIESCSNGCNNGMCRSASQCSTNSATYVNGNLCWAKGAVGTRKGIIDGLAYCEDLTLAGFTDWGVPSIGELRTVVRGCSAIETGGDCLVYDWSDYPNNACSQGCTESQGPGQSGCYLTSEIPCSRYWSSSGDNDSAYNLNYRTATIHETSDGNGSVARLDIICVRNN